MGKNKDKKNKDHRKSKGEPVNAVVIDSEHHVQPMYWDGHAMRADFTGGGGNYQPMFQTQFNGEKNLGAVGPIRNYKPNYEALRLRSWQSYYESEVSHTIVNSFIKWVIGKGLKLQCEPLIRVLEQEGIKFDPHKFCETVESRYQAWSNSSMSDYAQMNSKNEMSATAFKNVKLGGDVLVLIRYENDCVNIQLIDASHVQSPLIGTEYYPDILANGNKIINGIEFSPKGEHVRFFVRDANLNFTPIDAKNEAGLVCAFLYRPFSAKYRLDNVRGIPALSNVLEKIAMLERYGSAALGSAEERQKIAYVMEPELLATPQNPLGKDMMIAHDYYKVIQSQIPVNREGREVANTVAATTNKQTFLMPPGIKMKSVESKQELHFKEFQDAHIELICACLQIPPNVAMMLYTESFSSSRAALKDWEHTLHVERHWHSASFEMPIFIFWLHTEILKNKVPAPGYIKAMMTNNYMVLESYRSVRFAGAPVPHIDPLKEVMAERAKLGDAGASLPLTTQEAATEALSGGESLANTMQFSKELAESKKLKIEAPQPVATPAAVKPKKKPVSAKE